MTEIIKSVFLRDSKPGWLGYKSPDGHRTITELVIQKLGDNESRIGHIIPRGTLDRSGAPINDRELIFPSWLLKTLKEMQTENYDIETAVWQAIQATLGE